MKKLFSVLSAGVVVMLAGCVTNPSGTDMGMSCKALEGEWNGSGTGRIEGPMKVVFHQNCRYSWSGGFTTDGSLTQQNSESEFYYENRTGSRGIVVWDKQKKTLTFRNQYTGNNYTVVVQKSGN
ncbi:MAG: hypothetical protein RL758_652 [Pseudomonadota bacterium]|jgi:hypothetical protein